MMKMLYPRLAGLLLSLLAVGCSRTPSEPPVPVQVNIVAINDLHGYLQANPWRVSDPQGNQRTLNLGGIATLGGMLDQLRRQDPQLLFIGNGDLIGGSPAISSMWADEPTLLALHAMGLRLSSLGNHELDAGKVELLRQVNGGCQSPRPRKACSFRKDYPGSGFPYLAANLIDTDTGKPLLPAYRVEESHGVKVAFVGAVLRDVSDVVSAAGMKGLRATDEAEAINRLVPELKAQGVDAIVAVVHQGGGTPEPFDQADCSQLKGPIVEVAQRLDPAVNALLSAHSHQGYLCKVGHLLVTQGGSYGHLLTRLTLTIDPRAHRVTAITAANLPVDPQRYAPNPALAALQQEVEARSDKVLKAPAGRIAVPLVSSRVEANGESPMGDLVSDAQLEQARPWGAQLAFMNLGGIRAELSQSPGGSLSYAQAASVQPFGNTLVLADFTGEQLVALLNQQWQGKGFNPLQVSSGFTYQWDAARPLGQRVVPQSLRLDGKPVSPSGIYRVVANAFLAEGGDGFTLFKAGSARQDTGLVDVDALVGYLRTSADLNQPVGQADSAGRIVRLH